MPFSSIPEAIEDFRAGKMLVVVDDEDRENEGDLGRKQTSIRKSDASDAVVAGPRRDRQNCEDTPLSIDGKRPQQSYRVARGPQGGYEAAATSGLRAA